MRAEYKGLFLSDYQEYLMLHKTVQQVGAEFHQMKKLLEEQAPGTKEYQVCVLQLKLHYYRKSVYCIAEKSWQGLNFAFSQIWQIWKSL